MMAAGINSDLVMMNWSLQGKQRTAASQKLKQCVGDLFKSDFRQVQKNVLRSGCTG